MESKVTIAAVMTAPRCEITYARNYVERALKEANIPLTVSLGVFYGQCMQKMLEQLVNHGGVDYAVTVDFDSLFSAKQLHRLINLIHSNPEIDAITGMQVRRGKPTLLGTIPGGTMLDDDTKQVEWNGQPIQMTTAHFGLTVIDLKKLAAVPKPWFISKPNAKGEWDDDKIDDDVHFWMQWKEAGNTIYMDPAVKIGHLEEMVAIHMESGEVKHIYPSEWENVTYETSVN